MAPAPTTMAAIFAVQAQKLTEPTLAFSVSQPTLREIIDSIGEGFLFKLAPARRTMARPSSPSPFPVR